MDARATTMVVDALSIMPRTFFFHLGLESFIVRPVGAVGYLPEELIRDIYHDGLDVCARCYVALFLVHSQLHRASAILMKAMESGHLKLHLIGLSY